MRARTVAALLLVVTAALFAVGARAERRAENAESGATTEARDSDEAPGSGEHAEARESTETAESVENGEPSVLGVNPESPAAVGTAVLASLLLAAAIRLTGRREIAWAVVAFALAVALLDVRETGRQLDASRTGLAALALAVAIGHLGAAGAAAVSRPRGTWRRSPP